MTIIFSLTYIYSCLLFNIARMLKIFYFKLYLFHKIFKFSNAKTGTIASDETPQVTDELIVTSFPDLMLYLHHSNKF